MSIVTKELICKSLEREQDFVQHFVGRALVALFNRQVESEKKENTARIDNLEGFSKPDARAGSIGAKFYLKHKRLEDWQIDQWKKDWRGAPRLAKYARQLNEIAEQKRAA